MAAQRCVHQKYCRREDRPIRASCLNEALGLAVGPRGILLGEDLAQTETLAGLQRLPTLDLTYNSHSTVRHQAGIIVDVHPSLKLRTLSFPGPDWMDKLAEASQLVATVEPGDVIVIDISARTRPTTYGMPLAELAPSSSSYQNTRPSPHSIEQLFAKLKHLLRKAAAWDLRLRLPGPR